jgi:cytochrome P450
LYLAHGKRTGEKFSDAYLRDVVTNYMLAGRDTTACQLTWLFYRLMAHEDVSAKLQSEINNTVGDTREPNHDDFKGMEYLNGCIHEALRLHPSVPADTKVAVAADTLPDGQPFVKFSLLRSN